MERSAANILATGKWTRITAWIVGGVLLMMIVTGIWASRVPEVFWVNRHADRESAVGG